MIFRFRHRRLRVRIALLAIVALLWSQLALAGHADCFAALGADAPAEVAGVHAGCEDQAPSSMQPVCAAHCSHGDATAESGRIPPVPPMLAAPAIPLVSIAVIASGIDGGVPLRVDSPPPLSWHRPTAHPAALLLI